MKKKIKGAMGKKKCAGDEDSTTPTTSEVEVDEPTSIPTKMARGRKSIKSKGKKHTADELNDNETTADGDHT